MENVDYSKTKKEIIIRRHPFLVQRVKNQMRFLSLSSTSFPGSLLFTPLGREEERPWERGCAFFRSFSASLEVYLHRHMLLRKTSKVEKPLSFSFFKGIIHNLELLSFYKFAVCMGFLFKTQARERSARGFLVS